jgi:hypothetical protein
VTVIPYSGGTDLEGSAFLKALFLPSAFPAFFLIVESQ